MIKPVPENAILIPDDANCAFKGIIFDIYQWQQKLFDGTKSTFEMARRADTVQAICIVDERIVLVKDKQPQRPDRLKLPGGRVEKEDSDIEAAAKREVLEETGYQFGNWRLVKVLQREAKLEWFMYYLVAWNVLDRSEARMEAGEIIALELVDFEEAKLFGRDSVVKGILDSVESLHELTTLTEFKGTLVKR